MRRPPAVVIASFCAVGVLGSVAALRALPVEWGGRSGALSIGGTAYPITEDEVARRLRDRYEGRRVWMYGGGAFLDAPDMPPTDDDFATFFSVRDGKRLVVRRIARMRTGRTFTLGVRGSMFRDAALQNSYEVKDPLIVVLDIGSGDGIPATSFRFALYAGEGEFEKTFSLIPLSTASAKWPTRFRHAAESGEIVPGMTPEMVAWVEGWPPGRGSRKECERMSEWFYGEPAWIGCGLHVRFRDGRVTESFRTNPP